MQEAKAWRQAAPESDDDERGFLIHTPQRNASADLGSLTPLNRPRPSRGAPLRGQVRLWALLRQAQRPGKPSPGSASVFGGALFHSSGCFQWCVRQQHFPRAQPSVPSPGPCGRPVSPSAAKVEKQTLPAPLHLI